MRIAIYGAGSLGTILGAYIAKGGVAIDLINRNKAHIEALQTKGATFKLFCGNTSLDTRTMNESG